MGPAGRRPASASYHRGGDLAAARVVEGDVVICSGPIGDHGMAVMLARGDLALEA
jgi:hydrogenase expression/formation protein HypE